MVQQDGKTENQHYVPQFLLKNFTTGKKKRIWVFDKLEEKIFLTTPRNIASEQNFYIHEMGDNKLNLESSFNILESKAKNIIDKILKDESLTSLSEIDRVWLVSFVAAQFLRTRYQLELCKEMLQGLKQHTGVTQPIAESAVA
jgi:Protein of unknown function (DUF4238)